MNKCVLLTERIKNLLEPVSEGTSRQAYHKTCADMHIKAAEAHEACGHDPSPKAMQLSKQAHAYTQTAKKGENSYDGRNMAKAGMHSQAALENSTYNPEGAAKEHRGAASAHLAAAKNRPS